MLVVIADMFGIAGGRAELLELLGAQQDATASEDGCLRYHVSVGLDDTDHYVVIEQWRDRAALDAHYASPGFSQFQQALHGLLARPSEVMIHAVADHWRPVPGGILDPRDAD